MKKIYLLLLFAFAICGVQAQKRSVSTKLVPIKKPGLQFPQNGLTGTCNILNFPPPHSWGDTARAYPFDDYYPIDSGYVTGTNFYDDLEKAQFFDASATSDQYITGAYIGFAKAFSANKNNVVQVHVYDMNASGPHTVLGSADLIIKDITADVKDGYYTQVTFNPAIKLPASKKFFLSIDLSNLSWYNSPSDTLVIYSSNANKASGAWERYYTSATTSAWAAFSKNYKNFDVALYVHPFLSETQTCSLLPVHLLSFNAQAKGKSAVLDWKVTQEIGLKEYVVEKAMLNQPFTAAGTVAATNSQLDHSYTFTDADALASGNLLYYRLKQVDKDGKVNYSNVITLSASNSALSIKVVNPFKNAVQLQINAPYVQKMQGGIYDMQGRKIAAVTEQMLAAGQNSVQIPTGLLAKGIYILNLTVGRTTYKYKIVN